MILDTQRLQLELDRRGLTKAAFARAAGVSKNTLTAAANSRRVSPRTVGQLVRTLVSIPPLHMVDELIARPAAVSPPGSFRGPSRVTSGSVTTDEAPFRLPPATSTQDAGPAEEGA